MDAWFTHDSNLTEYIESYGKDWIGPLRSNWNVTYGGEEIYVDALKERIDKTEREIDNETYKIRTQKPLSRNWARYDSSLRRKLQTTRTKRIRCGISLRTRSVRRLNI